jgi:hypothetical protein
MHLSREIDGILNRLERLQRVRWGQRLPSQIEVKSTARESNEGKDSVLSR